MANGTSMSAERRDSEEEYGTTNLKKAQKVAALKEARLGQDLLKRASDPVARAEEERARMEAMAPGGARGATQTINVRSGMAGNAGRTAQAARAAGQGAQSAAQQAASRVQQQAAGQLRERYGLQEQDAARGRVAGGLAKGAEATFAEKLAQGAIQGAVQGGISAGTTAATGGLSQLTGVIPEGFKAVQK